MRKRLFEIIERAQENDRASNIYDIFMFAVIVVSMVPLAFKVETVQLWLIDKICVTIFIIDYILRIFTADLKLKKGVKSFFIYPFTPLAIIDLICILPSFNIVKNGFMVLKIFRLFRAFRILRILKAVRYWKTVKLIRGVFVRQKKPLLTGGAFAVAYILLSALVIFNVEPDTFNSYFDAVYWATVSLTTMGYGDIYPVTSAGRVITMLSSFFGIAIIALPAGIVTAGFMEEVNGKKKDK